MSVDPRVFLVEHKLRYEEACREYARLGHEVCRPDHPPGEATRLYEVLKAQEDRCRQLREEWHAAQVRLRTSRWWDDGSYWNLDINGDGWWEDKHGRLLGHL